MVGAVHAAEVASGCTSVCASMWTRHAADVTAGVQWQSRKYNKSWLKMASVSWRVTAAGGSPRAPLLGAQKRPPRLPLTESLYGQPGVVPEPTAVAIGRLQGKVRVPGGPPFARSPDRQLSVL